MLLAFNREKLSGLAASVVIAFIVLAGAMLALPSRADAATGATSNTSFVGYSGVLAMRDTTKTVIASGRIAGPLDTLASWANEVACDVSGPIGAGLSATTGVCDDTLVGSMTEGVMDAVNCATDLQKCIGSMIGEAMGKGVSWAANGIVKFVLDVRDECAPAGGSSSWTSGTDTACTTRVEKDYYGAASSEVLSGLTEQNKDKVIELQKKLSGLVKTNGSNPDTPEITAVRNELRALGAINIANGNLTVDDLKTEIDKNSTFTVPKSAVATSTFKREYFKYTQIAFLLMIPLLMAGALQAVVTGKPHLLMRSVVINVPLAFIAMRWTPDFMRQFMELIDVFSGYIISDVKNDVSNYFAGMGSGFGNMALTLLLPLILIGIVFIFASMLVWFIMSMRQASVAILGIFMPIAFAAGVWPSLGKWALRGIKLLMAAIISKVFIVGAISLGIGTFANGNVSGSMDFSQMVYGATIFFIAAFSPHLVMKFFDEIGDALNAAGGTGALARGLSVSGNMNGTRTLFTSGRGGGGAGGAAAGGLGNSAPLAGSIAGSLESQRPGATPQSVARAQVGGTIGAGGTGSQAATAGGDGMRRMGGGAMEQLGEAYRGAAEHAAPGQAYGTLSQEQAGAAGGNVGQAMLDGGATRDQSVRSARDAASQAAGGGAAGAAAADRAEAQTNRAADQRTQHARRNRRDNTSLSRKAARLAMTMTPFGAVAYGIGAARRRNNDEVGA